MRRETFQLGWIGGRGSCPFGGSGDQNGNAIHDRVAAVATGASKRYKHGGVPHRFQRLSASRTDDPAQKFVVDGSAVCHVSILTTHFKAAEAAGFRELVC